MRGRKAKIKAAQPVLSPVKQAFKVYSRRRFSGFRYEFVISEVDGTAQEARDAFFCF